MAQFKAAMLTRKGTALLAKAQAESAGIAFTRAVTGCGEYEDGEDIASRGWLKEFRQEFAPSSVQRRNDTNVHVRFVITNRPDTGALEHGYYVTEVGLMAQDPDEGEILYGIAVGETGKCDYLPAYNDLLPATIGVDFLIEVANAEHVEIRSNLSAYAMAEDLEKKADAVAFDAGTSEVVLKANGREISRASIPNGKADMMTYSKETSILSLMAGELTLAEALIVSAASEKLEERVARMQSDLAGVAFQLALHDIGNTDGMTTVHVDVIDSASAVRIISGTYADGKVYI